MNILDRIFTIVITATLTSAVCIIAGGSLIDSADNGTQGESAGADNRKSTANLNIESGGDPALAQASDIYVDSSIQQQSTPPLGQSVDGRSDTDETRQLIVPVINVRRTELIDTYTASRAGGKRVHEAIDIIAPTGTSVIAAAPGTIEKLFVSDDGGNTIYIRSSDRRTIHYYAHLDQYTDGLKEGQRIRRGQQLGTVGASGNASEDAPHLHFAIMRTTPEAEWYEPSSSINPYPLLMGKTTF